MRVKNHNAPSKSRAWVAGWDASITFRTNPYKRRDFRAAFERGRTAGKASTPRDVAALHRMLENMKCTTAEG